MIAALQLVAMFAVPVFILKYRNWALTRWIGTIGTAYLLGILVALLVLLLNELGVSFQLDTDIGEIGSHAAIGIAIPLLLFSANLKEAKKLSKVVLKSFFGLVVSAVVVTTIVFYVYARTIEHGAVLSGMAIGVYTGGTPNLNAIAKIFGLPATILAGANLADMMIGAVFYVFLLILAKPLLGLFLRRRQNDIYVTAATSVENAEAFTEPFVLTKALFQRILLAFGIVVLGAAFGLIVWVILGMEDGRMIDYLVPTLMITVTVLGIAGSFIEKVRATSGMNVVGQYLILVFSFALASSIDFSLLSGVFATTIVLYGTITLGVFVLHALLGRLMDVDVDCTMITLTAGLYGPAFVPAITKQIKNDDLTAPGLIVGSIGYAIGTFLGMVLVYVYVL
jgi:uncharacterized membrane protein